ncbi:MAG: hypothetical protein V1740_07985 [Candidatus Woesearchaeota archaeon]
MLHEKPKLLFTHNPMNENFCNAIAYAHTNQYDHLIVDELSRGDYRFIDRTHGVVLVGPQTSDADILSVFRSEGDYLAFIQEVHKRCKKVAAVLNKPDVLPGDNKEIDLLIETVRGERTITSIAREISDFFQSG